MKNRAGESIGLVRTTVLRPIKTICAYHKLYFPQEGEYVISDGETRNGMVSHGICGRCTQKLREEYPGYFERR